jgi:hypothetical protein
METYSFSETTPSVASTAVGFTLGQLSRYRGLRIEAFLIGATGGTLDVYLQRKLGPNAWTDWCHFAQLASGAGAAKLTLSCDHANSTSITAAANVGTDAAPGVALAAGTFVGGHPGDTIRAVYVAGASTSAGAALAFHITGIGGRR